MLRINGINGIPLHYARTSQYPYGSLGYQKSFSIEKSFHKTLKACFSELFTVCPLGMPNVITCGGVQVSKPGQHGPGRAFDLDALFWEDYSLVTRNFLQDPLLYLGIESYLRKYFGVVLNYFYDNAHKDHWHIDNSYGIAFNKNSRSKVVYVQLVLNYVYDMRVLIDGVWGPQTAGAVAEVFQMLDIKGEITTKKYWIEYLDLSGTIAFQLFEQDKNPRALINSLYATLIYTDFPQKNSVLESLNSFLNHDETESWLDGFSVDGDLNTIIEEVKTIA